jgi:hypothetical protein
MYIVVTEVEDKQKMSDIATLIHTDDKFLVWTFVGHSDDIERLGVTIKGMILIQV